MKRTMLLILSIFLLSAHAEEIDSPLVHADEVSSEFVAVDFSPVITFQTGETGVFAVVVLASSEELSTPAEDEIVEDQKAAFLVTTHSTPHSITYTLTQIQTTNQGGPD